MIIQQVIKGIGGINDAEAAEILKQGIVCNWWRKVNLLPADQIPLRLTQRNLDWHQNHYYASDPLESGEEFGKHTPFISTTAGTIERDTVNQTSIMTPAWQVALSFATNSGTSDGFLFYCYLLIIGKPTVEYQAFAEELRELNVYTGFSRYQPEGEITAKIIIPPAQIERADFWSKKDAMATVKGGNLPGPGHVIPNPLFVPPEKYNNVRDVLS